MRRSLSILKNLLPAALPVERVRQLLNLTSTVATAWLCAGVVSQAIASFMPTPTTDRRPARPAAEGEAAASAFRSRYVYDVIVERNLFDSTNKIAQQGRNKMADDLALQRPRNGPPQLSTLPVKLLGTIVSSDPTQSLATVAVSGKDAEQFGLGDRILGQAVITSIERNRVYLINNGAKEYLETEDAKAGQIGGAMASLTPEASAGGGVREVNPGKFVVDKSRVEQVMSNLTEVMTQARVVPHFESGKPAGWKIFAIKPNSIYQELNLQNGDIIQRINGVEVDSPAKALEMYQQLASESHVTIDIVRQGGKQTLDYDIR